MRICCDHACHITIPNRKIVSHVCAILYDLEAQIAPNHPLCIRTPSSADRISSVNATKTIMYSPCMYMVSRAGRVQSAPLLCRFLHNYMIQLSPGRADMHSKHNTKPSSHASSPHAVCCVRHTLHRNRGSVHLFILIVRHDVEDDTKTRDRHFSQPVRFALCAWRASCR